MSQEQIFVGRGPAVRLHQEPSYIIKNHKRRTTYHRVYAIIRFLDRYGIRVCHL